MPGSSMAANVYGLNLFGQGPNCGELCKAYCCPFVC